MVATASHTTFTAALEALIDLLIRFPADYFSVMAENGLHCLVR
jgi:hypothetical protein